MSRIARQLCDEIVTPLKRKECQLNYDEIPKRCTVIKTPRISKVVPKDSTTSQIKFKVINKVLIDAAINTIHRGPIVTSDNHCVTSIRSRATEKCNCKAPPRQNSLKKSVKGVQTLNLRLYTFLNKACLQCVDTVSCGTQFFNFGTTPLEKSCTTCQSMTPKDSKQLNKLQWDYLKQIGVKQRDNRERDAKLSNVKQSVLRLLELRKLAMDQTNPRQKLSKQCDSVQSLKKVPIHYMGARRWSLSKNPIKGPDF